MRSAFLIRLPFLLLLVAVARCQGPPPNMVNPHTQIRWPIACTQPGQAYIFQTNTCIDVMHIDPSRVTWPVSCSTGTYVPASNTCVATGTAANPGGIPGDAQVNVGGTFGPAGAKVDASFNWTFPGSVAASSVIPASAPMFDLRHPSFAGGMKCDGTTDIGPAVQAAVNALPVNGSEVEIVGGTIAAPCYWANPFSLAIPTTLKNQGTFTIVLQGVMTTGTTFVMPAHAVLKCRSGGQQFQFQSGESCQIKGPTAWGTLGTATAGSFTTGVSTVVTPTFTTGSMTAFQVGTHVAITDTTTCNIASITRTANNVTAVCSNAAHIPAGPIVTVAGVTGDTTFNGTFQVAASDYGGSPTANSTIKWQQTAADSGPITGAGTITGFNEDTKEDVQVTAITGTTFTATFYRVHAASAVWGIDGLVPGGADLIEDVSVSSSGSALYFTVGSSGSTLIKNVSAIQQCSQPASAFPVEINRAFWITFEHVTFLTCQRPWALRETDSFNDGANGAGVVVIKDSVISAGIQVDHFAQGPTVQNTVIEQGTRGAIQYDPTNYNSGTAQAFNLDNVGLQDNYVGYHSCDIYELYPFYAPTLAVPTVHLKDVNGVATPCVVNDYFIGALQTHVLGSQTVKFNLYKPKGIVGTFSDGKTMDGELTGEGSGMGPSVIPFATANVKTDPATWVSLCGASCTVTTGQLAPDGSLTAGALTSTSLGSPLILTYSVTPAVGDMILYGGWVYVPTPGKSDTGGGSGTNFLIDNFASSHFNFDSGVSAKPIIYDSSITDDWWHPVVGVTTVTVADGTAGSIRFFLTAANDRTWEYWQPFFIYIPASANVPLAEVMRWRAQLLHGYVPTNFSAPGSTSMPPASKMYWGNDTNLYRSAAGVLQTDGTINAVGGLQINGTPLTSPVLPEWTSGGVRTAGAALAANVTQLWSFTLPGSNTSTKVSYSPSTPDNTGNLYDLGIYSASGTLLCHVGATAGTSFAPSTSVVTLPWLLSCPLAGNTRYLLGMTAVTATAVINNGGLMFMGVARANPTVGNATAGGVLNNSVTPPADSWSNAQGFPQISLHN